MDAPHTPRRGALLLLVLGILTLFVLIGTVMLTLATRARTTARAFSAATAGTAAGPILARAQLDEALLRLIRGGADSAGGGLTETLLGDMYGSQPTLEGTATEIEKHGVLVKATITLTGSGGQAVVARDLPGRVITFKPGTNSSDAITSLRVIRASGTSALTCWMAMPAATASPLPRPPCAVVINPPAFRDEPYDAYDDDNAWLTQVRLQDGAVAGVPRPAFARSGTPAEVDNDNDGVKDGVWVSGLFDDRPASGGGRLTFDVSYLVLDLDGRVNVNAHGNRTSIEFPASGGFWDGAPDVPTGSGYGPADVDASLLFVETSSTSQMASDPPRASDRWRRLLGDPMVGGLTAVVSSTSQRRTVPLVGVVDGRYGDAAVPGDVGDDLLTRRGELLYGGNPLVDLKCMIKAQMSTGAAAVPTLTCFCPDWSRAGFADDPYEMRLDADAQRPNELRAGTSAADNPFTLADLETVLRQFDPDAPTLSPRLAVALDKASQRSRMLLTTDSWDTPGLTGDRATEISAYVATLACDPARVMAPDVLAGLRFDINRPFPDGDDELPAKQDYCKHLFTLLVALGQPANAATAQWAANVLDYRDPDSKFTRFQFDTNPADGWGPGTSGWNETNVVWGVERPELVIAQTLAWRDAQTATAGELFVSLHRPWNAVMIGPGGERVPIDTLDPALAASPASGTSAPPRLDLAKRIGNDPVWRLRFDADSKFVRFDALNHHTGSHEAFPAGTTTFGSTDTATMAPDSYLVVRPSGTSSVGITVAGGMGTFRINAGGTFRAERWTGAGNDQPGSDTMVFLERLADPSRAWHATTNPYVKVDQLGIKIVNRTGVDPNNWRSFFRDPPFWRHRPFSKIMRPPTIKQLDAQATNWMPWANRAYISHAELMLVPQGNALEIMTDYDIPRNKSDSSAAYWLPTDKLLDATIVPSRFVGSQVSVAASTLSPVGMEKIPFNQLSRWREPGRVNLNTIVPNEDCSDPRLDNAVWWATLGPDALVTLDQFRAGGPARSIRDLLTLMQDGENYIYIDTAADVGSKRGVSNSYKKNRPYDLDPSAAFATAIRLANVATIRSHVFAVWITLRVHDSSPGGVEAFHRLFAIVDRSRPVGYREGQNLNVRDTIRILRFLE